MPLIILMFKNQHMFDFDKKIFSTKREQNKTAVPEFKHFNLTLFLKRKNHGLRYDLHI